MRSFTCLRSRSYMISHQRTFLFLTLFVPCLVGLHADTVVLKTGESLEGKILQQSADSVTIEYKISSSITDQKVIPTADIAKIDKIQPDEVAFTAIQAYKVDPEWSMQPENYDRMSQALNEFLIQYPNSAHAADVKKNLTEITTEQARVQSGELKMFGNWLSKEQASKQQAQVQAQVVFSNMRDQAMRGDYIGALNLFEMMKSSCKTALIFPAAVQLAGVTIQNLERQVAAAKIENARDEANWTKTIAMTSEPKKSQLLAGRAQNAARAEATLAAATKSGAKWLPIIAHSPKSLEAVERTIASEKSSLASIPVAKMRESIDRANKAADAVAAKDIASAEAYLKEAQTLWPTNGALDLVKAEIADQKAASKPTPSPTPSKEELAKAAAKKAAAAATPAAPEVVEATPFYMTPTGAGVIVVGLLVAIGLGSVLARVLNKPKESA